LIDSVGDTLVKPGCRDDIGWESTERSSCFSRFFWRFAGGRVIYPLPEVLLLCLLAVQSGAEDFVTIAWWGQGRINFLRRFLPFKDGTPSHDQLGDIFATLLKDRRLHPIHAIDHDCFGLRMCSTHCMDASSHWLSGGLLGVRNASIFMTIMAT
jgi:hypothetical protein